MNNKWLQWKLKASKPICIGESKSVIYTEQAGICPDWCEWYGIPTCLVQILKYAQLAAYKTLTTYPDLTLQMTKKQTFDEYITKTKIVFYQKGFLACVFIYSWYKN